MPFTVQMFPVSGAWVLVDKSLVVLKHLNGGLGYRDYEVFERIMRFLKVALMPSLISVKWFAFSVSGERTWTLEW